MATQLKNLSVTTLTPQKEFKKLHIGIVVSEWNTQITGSLLAGAVEFLLEMGVKEKNIHVHSVPGSYELPLGAQWMALQKNMDAVLTLGCVIQGETRHFDFICDACAHGVMQVGLDYNIPVVFGVLTTNTLEQAMERAGGKHGNKGVEAAETALKMLLVKHKLNA
ncbi:MAG: 6,7-dimethyl-8-ribityllumazine synthase [Bacteroidota bacterium]